MLTPEAAAALLRAVLPLAREYGVSSLELGRLKITLGPPPVSARRAPQTDEEAEEEAAAAEEEHVGYAKLALAAARAAR